jgi:hypothetical protein
VVRLPREISPAAASRRALLGDFVAASLLALVAILVAAGIGVVGVVALLVLIVLGGWIGIEFLIRAISRRRGEPRRARTRRPGTSARTP